MVASFPGEWVVSLLPVCSTWQNSRYKTGAEVRVGNGKVLSLHLRIKSPAGSLPPGPSLSGQTWVLQAWTSPKGRAVREDESERFLSPIAWAKCGRALLSGQLSKAA